MIIIIVYGNDDRNFDNKISLIIFNKSIENFRFISCLNRVYKFYTRINLIRIKILYVLLKNF